MKVMTERSEVAVEFLCIILADGFLHIHNLYLHGRSTKLNLNDVPCLHVHRSFGGAVIDQDPSGIAGFIRDSSSLNQTGYFQVFI